jgi:hypothetical protein
MHPINCGKFVRLIRLYGHDQQVESEKCDNSTVNDCIGQECSRGEYEYLFVLVVRELY